MSGFRKRALRHRTVVLGGAVLLVIVCISILAPFLTKHDPMDVRPRRRLSEPSWEHPFGTDDLGRDVYARVIYGGRLSLLIGASVMVLSSVFGITIGLVAGYFDAVDRILMRILDGVMAFPGVLMAVALMAVFGSSAMNVILAISIVYTPRTARIIRSGVLAYREYAFVEAARASGSGDTRIMFLHILPNCVGPLIVQSTFVLANAMLLEASLSFLGVGVPPQVPSWGTILSGGGIVMRVAPWVLWFPGLAIIIAVLATNLLGDGLRDVLDPYLQES